MKGGHMLAILAAISFLLALFDAHIKSFTSNDFTTLGLLLLSLHLVFPTAVPYVTRDHKSSTAEHRSP
jgi:hypothetical protein